MKFVSLFSGIGLHDLGLTWAGWQPVAQCEIDPYCNAVLSRHWPNTPRFEDVKNVNRANILANCGGVSPRAITGGFPCQQISCAGKGAGIGTAASPTAVSGLWWEMWRIIAECRPDWLLIENVPALRTRGYDAVADSLEEIGYTCWPLVVGAEHVGAPHKRHRCWIVAYAAGNPGGTLRRAIVHALDGAGDAAACSVGDAAGTRRARGEPGAGGPVLDQSRRPELSGRSVSNELEHAPRDGWNERRAESTGHERQSAATGAGARSGAGVGLAVANRELPHRAGLEGHGWTEPANSGGGGAGLADSDRAGCGEQRGAVAIPAQQSALERPSAYRWPARPGERQYEWECPRTVARSKSRLGGPANGHRPRLATRAAQLKALGNANPPQVPYLIACAINRADAFISGGQHAG